MLNDCQKKLFQMLTDGVFFIFPAIFVKYK
jgi:hypothetical protein